MKYVHVVLMSEWHVSSNVFVSAYTNKSDAATAADKLNAQTCDDIHYTVQTKPIN